MSPDGKTAYVLGNATGGNPELIPIATATNTPGKPVGVGQGVGALAITPDGQTIYLADYRPVGVIPHATATNTPGKLIRFGGFIHAIAVVPIILGAAPVLPRPPRAPGPPSTPRP